MTLRIFFQKIVRDLLISLIVTYFLMLVPELILPGMISSHFSPKNMLVAILLLGWLLAWRGTKNYPEESSKFKVISRNILNIILFLIAAMLLLSLYKMKLWQIFIVTAFSIALIVASANMLTGRKGRD